MFLYMSQCRRLKAEEVYVDLKREMDFTFFRAHI